MTPTTPEQQNFSECKSRSNIIRGILDQLLEQVDALTKERDALLVAAKYAEHIDATPSNQVQTMLYDTLVERDELRLQIDIQAGSIEAVQAANQRLAKERDALAANHKECVKCLGEALQDRADLAEAAKLALDATVLLNGDAHLMMMSDDGPAGTYANKVFHKTCLSIEALRQAGVQ